MNNQLPFGYQNQMMPLPNQNFNMMPMPNYGYQTDTTLAERINLLEQKIQNIDNRLKKLERANIQTEITDGFYQYKNSMHMM